MTAGGAGRSTGTYTVPYSYIYWFKGSSRTAIIEICRVGPAALLVNEWLANLGQHQNIYGTRTVVASRYCTRTRTVSTQHETPGHRTCAANIHDDAMTGSHNHVTTYARVHKQRICVGAQAPLQAQRPADCTVLYLLVAIPVSILKILVTLGQ